MIWYPAGLAPITLSDSRADGDSVDVAYDDPERVKMTGFYGRKVASTATNLCGSITVTLQASSGIAKRLRQIAAEQEIAIRTGGVVPEGPLVLVAPDSTAEIATLAGASLTSVPNVTLGNESPSRAWVWKGLLEMGASNTLD